MELRSLEWGPSHSFCTVERPCQLRFTAPVPKAEAGGGVQARTCRIGGPLLWVTNQLRHLFLAGDTESVSQPVPEALGLLLDLNNRGASAMVLPKHCGTMCAQLYKAPVGCFPISPLRLNPNHEVWNTGQRYASTGDTCHICLVSGLQCGCSVPDLR